VAGALIDKHGHDGVAEGLSTEERDALTIRPRRRKTGGRRAGTPNKRTAALRAAIAALLVPGTDPRTFFAAILRNEDAPLELRFAAAKALAPFVHPKLASIEARTGGKTHEDRLAEYHQYLEDDQPNAPELDRGDH
jgi:hypothetical protein